METSQPDSYASRWAAPRGDRDESLEAIIRSLIKLIRKAEHVNRSCSPILGVITLCALPVACSCMFMITYAEGDVMLIGYTYALISSMYTLFAFSLQAIAGLVTADAELLVKQLTDIVCMEARLQMKQRNRLLLLIQEIVSDHHLLAMKKTTGEPYTLIDFADHVCC